MSGECESTANLNVQPFAAKGTIPSFVQRIGDQRVTQNSTIKFTCQVNGSPHPSISWFKVKSNKIIRLNFVYF